MISNSFRATRYHERSISWGEKESSKLLVTILSSNHCAFQAVQQQDFSESTRNFWNHLSLETLETKDDLGVSLIFLCIHYNRIELFKYLYYERNLNFSIYCDSLDFGMAMYYAILYNRIEMIDLLDSWGYYVTSPCDVLQTLPLQLALYRNQQEILQIIEKCILRVKKTKILFMKNYLKVKFRKRYLMILVNIRKLQQWVRRRLGKGV